MKHHNVVVGDSKEAIGYHVIDGDGLLNGSPGMVLFLESLEIGECPSIAYVVPVKGKKDPNASRVNRFLLRKSRIIRVI